MKKTSLFILFSLICTGILSLFIVYGFTTIDNISQEYVLEKEEKVRRADIVFVGDIMFDRYIRSQSEKRQGGYEGILDVNLLSLIEGAHYAIANLEGPVTSYESKSKNSRVGDAHNTTFTFDPRVLSVLKQWGFDALSLANNHIGDFGDEGVRQTIEYLEATPLDYFGVSRERERITHIETIRGIKVAFVGYSEFARGPDASEVLSEIERVRPYTDTIIVFAHWGNEYVEKPTESQRETARRFVDAGANAVIGAHAHIIAEAEEYKGAPMYYSLGNFIFDQYFSPEVRCGLVLTLQFEKKGSEVRIAGKEHSFVYLENDGASSFSSCGERYL